MRRSRRRTDTKAPSRLAVSGVLVTALALGFLWFGYRSVTGVPGQDYTTLHARIPDVGNLRAHDEVRIAGVRVGQVLNPTVRDEQALVEIQLQPGVGRLPDDTRAIVRARGLLGSRYLELTPGRSSRLLAEGATIQQRPVTSITHGVSDVLDAFDARTRGGLRSVVGELGQGVAARGGPLNEVIERGPGLTDQIDRVAASLLAREPATRAFVPSVESGTRALDAAREAIARGFGATADGMQPFVRARAATRDTLDEAPGTLRAVRAGLSEGRRLLGSVRTLAGSINTTLPAAPAGLRQTTALLRESPPALRRALPLLDELEPTVPAVLGITRALRPNLTPLRRAFTDLRPIVGTLGAHGCDVENFADNWRSVLGYGAPSQRALPGGDAGNFNQLRVHQLAGPESLGSLLPNAVPLRNPQRILAPPCTHSPGPKYSGSVTDLPRRRR